jgi:hypothetical protein
VMVGDARGVAGRLNCRPAGPIGSQHGVAGDALPRLTPLMPLRARLCRASSKALVSFTCSVGRWAGRAADGLAPARGDRCRCSTLCARSAAARMSDASAATSGDGACSSPAPAGMPGGGIMQAGDAQEEGCLAMAGGVPEMAGLRVRLLASPGSPRLVDTCTTAEGVASELRGSTVQSVKERPLVQCLPRADEFVHELDRDVVGAGTTALHDEAPVGSQARRRCLDVHPRRALAPALAHACALLLAGSVGVGDELAVLRADSGLAVVAQLCHPSADG